MPETYVQWQRFIGDVTPSGAVRPVILESWRRSRAAGVDPKPARVGLRRVSAVELGRRLTASADLVSVARPHLEWLSSALDAIRHVAYVVDRDGVVLHATGTDEEGMRTLGLEPGFDWSEAMMGTNGAGTALAARAPVSVRGAEHYAAPFHGVWCTGAPIVGPDGAVVGAVDISSSVEDGSADRLLAVAHLAYTIGQELAYRASIRRTGRALEIQRDLADALRASERRVRLLQELTAALGSALTVQDVASAVVPRGLEALGADGGSLLVLDRDLDRDGETCRIVRGLGYGEEANREWFDRPIPVTARMPVTDPFRTGALVELESLADWKSRYPDVAPYHERYGFDGLTVIPCALGDDVIGALALSFRTPRLLSGDDRSLGVALAQQCAQSLERARLYELEQRARRDAEAANRAKSEFLSVVSHELRTPLNAIAGYTQLLQLGIGEEASRADFLTRILAAQRHLTSLVDAVLNLARIEAGRIEYHIGSVPVHELLGAIDALVAPQLREKSLAYRVADADPSLVVRADREKVKLVLINLVGNAIKFTGAGGTITLALDVGEHAIALHVRDTGVGIPPEKLATIFDPFVQLDRGLTRTAGGVGLGLAISREFARGMGGDLTVESCEGEGSTFTIALPRAL